MIELDGSYGEGGGQILRTALACAAVSGRPFRIERIRGGRKRPGLLRQHLTAVKAAAEICAAEVEGAELGSQEVVFQPGELRGGEYEFAVGTAGSAMLVLQTVMMPLLNAEAPSSLTLKGGTHARSAPPLEFVEESLAPLVRRIGGDLQLKLKQYGFFPAGGGEVQVEIRPPAAGFEPLNLLDRGTLQEGRVEVLTAFLPNHVADRELMMATEIMKWPRERGRIRRVRNAHCAGNAVMIHLGFGSHQEVFTSFGERGKRAEAVASECARDAQLFLRGPGAVGEHLADQLLLPMALGAGGRFRTGPLSGHGKTQLWLLPRLLDVEVAAEEKGSGLWEVRVDV